MPEQRLDSHNVGRPYFFDTIDRMTYPFTLPNNQSRARLEALTRRLTDGDLTRTTAAGWTVAALLAHLAYWDERMVVLLKRWKEHGVDFSPVDADAINDALKPLCLALEPRKAVALCLEAAAAADAELETITPELYAEIQASGTHFRFDRSLHRDDHLGAIERLIGE
jgi:hypothetical protein